MIVNPYNIQIRSYSMGTDMVFHITGGAAHIGAMAVAYFNENDKGVHDQLEVFVRQLPHHREGELAKECAELAAKTLKVTASVLMGIHIDHATKEQIEDIVEYVRKSMKETLEEIQR